MLREYGVNAGQGERRTIEHTIGLRSEVRHHGDGADMNAQDFGSGFPAPISTSCKKLYIHINFSVGRSMEGPPPNKPSTNHSGTNFRRVPRSHHCGLSRVQVCTYYHRHVPAKRAPPATQWILQFKSRRYWYSRGARKAPSTIQPDHDPPLAIHPPRQDPLDTGALKRARP